MFFLHSFMQIIDAIVNEQPMFKALRTTVYSRFRIFASFTQSNLRTVKTRRAKDVTETQNMVWR